jgi:hypothetical protein
MDQRSNPLSPAERKAAILVFLEDHPYGGTARYIAGGVGLSKPYTHTLLRALEADGVVQRDRYNRAGSLPIDVWFLPPLPTMVDEPQPDLPF